jgi:hypothetical protein
VISKIFKLSKVPSKIYILSCIYISFKMTVSLMQTTCAPSRSLGTSVLEANIARPMMFGMKTLQVTLLYL